MLKSKSPNGGGPMLQFLKVFYCCCVVFYCFPVVFGHFLLRCGLCRDSWSLGVIEQDSNIEYRVKKLTYFLMERK